MRTRLLFLPLWLAGGLAALAAPPGQPAPPKPFVVNAPANSQWTATYQPKSPENKPATEDDVRARAVRQRYSPMVLSRHVIKAPGKMVIYTTYETDLKSEDVVGWHLSLRTPDP